MPPRSLSTRLTCAMGMALLCGLVACERHPGWNTSLSPAEHTAFPIADEGPHDGLACTTCHGQLDSFRSFNCHSAGCHAEVVIRPKHALEPGFEFVSQSCYLCHPRGGRDGRIDHTSFFPIQAGDAHQNTSCSVCHTASSSPTKVTCAEGGCHTEAETEGSHLAVEGYRWGAATCLGCHPNGKVASVDHRALFPIGPEDRHGEVRCGTCHIDPDEYRVVGCINGACHSNPSTDTLHAQVIGYEYRSESCLGCHPNGLPGLADHTKFFPIGAGELHGGLGCAKCHEVSDRKQVTCLGGGCHAAASTDSAHGAVLGYDYRSASCLACHPGASVGTIDHGSFFPIASGDKHTSIACETCHRNPGARTPVTCVGASCHRPFEVDPVHVGFADYVYASASCINCHPRASRRIGHEMFPTRGGTKHADIACLRCHSVPSDRHALSCATTPCHTPTETALHHTEVGGYQWVSSICLRCHGDGLVRRVADHLPFGITDGYAHNKRSCLSCHPSLRADRPALTDFSSRNCFSAGCHIQTLVTAAHLLFAPGRYQPIPNVCTQSACHENGRRPM